MLQAAQKSVVEIGSWSSFFHLEGYIINLYRSIGGLAIACWPLGAGGGSLLDACSVRFSLKTALLLVLCVEKSTCTVFLPENWKGLAIDTLSKDGARGICDGQGHLSRVRVDPFWAHVLEGATFTTGLFVAEKRT